MQTSPKQRLIVALDVPTHDEAIKLANTLDNVSFFKVGLELLLAGDLFGFLERLKARRGEQGVFLDLKTGGDISRTIGAVVSQAGRLGIRFMTFIPAADEAITDHTLSAGHAARGSDRYPKFVAVPMLSSIDMPDMHIVDRGRSLLDKGFDGLVLSGTSIRACRKALGPDFQILSPGIRPTWYNSSNDHKRYTTPAAAIEAGADYLVVGRPILKADDPRAAAERIIDEMANVPLSAV